MNSSPKLSDEDYCADQLRDHDADRYLIALFQPRPKRRATIALAAWNLELARARPRSGEETIGLMRLQWHRDALAEIAEGRPRRHPVVGELAAAHKAGLIDLAGLEPIVDARERDLDPAPPKSLADLEAYARATSGALHAALWQDTPAAQAAEDAGTAFALIGLARSEAVNAGRGRPWAPKGLAHDLRPIVDRGLKLCETAAPRGCRAAMAPAVLARAYARRAERAGFDASSPLMAAPDPRRLWRMLGAKLRGKI